MGVAVEQALRRAALCLDSCACLLPLSLDTCRTHQTKYRVVLHIEYPDVNLRETSHLLAKTSYLPAITWPLCPDNVELTQA